MGGALALHTILTSYYSTAKLIESQRSTLSDNFKRQTQVRVEKSPTLFKGCLRSIWSQGLVMLIGLTSVVLCVSVFLVIPIGRSILPTPLPHTITAEVSGTPPSTFRKVCDKPFRTILLYDKIISSDGYCESCAHH